MKKPMTQKKKKSPRQMAAKKMLMGSMPPKGMETQAHEKMEKKMGGY